MQATCPLCGEYEGSPQQVQAHISSKKDAEHKGRYGREFEDKLNPQAGSQQKGQQQGETAVQKTQGSSPSKETQSTQAGQQSPQTGQQAPPRGGRARGTTVDMPDIECEKCGRKVKYPEMMPYKASCAGCGKEIRKREAFEKIEEKADEKGKNELVESQTV